MQKKVKCEVTVVVAVLFFSVIISGLQVSNVGAQANPNAQVGMNFGVTNHKMSPAELEQYRNATGTYQEGTNYNQLVAGHGTGLSPPTTSEWAVIAKNAYVVDNIMYQAPLPTVVDLSKSAWFPPIGDQGNQGSCSFFADVYYAKTYQEAKEHQWNLSQATWVGRDPVNTATSDNGHVADEYQNRVMSPAFVYHLINNGTHIGSSLEAPIMVMCSIGVSSWQNMPYDQKDISSWPSEAAWAQAPYYRSNSSFLYQYIFANQTNGITNLKNWLAAGNVAVVAIDANDNLYPVPENNTQDLFTLDNYRYGPLDHAQTIVGYNDSITYIENGTVHTGAFKIVNSWGVDGWENVPDGCYWMSYQVMAKLSATGSPVVLSQDLTGYEPEILATFNFNHAARSDCNITFGLGNPNQPVTTKIFDHYFSEGDLYLGGKQPFCTNNIVFDLTEFKSYMSSLYNQPFFMKVYDKGPSEEGTDNNGTINYFAIGNTSSTQTPIQTIQSHTVTLTLNYSLAQPTLTVTPTSGPPSAPITLTGIGFTGTSVNTSYLNPITLVWIPITTNLATPSMNFTYSTHAPDLLQINPSGDTPPDFDNITFRVQDNGSGNSYTSTAPYMEWHRGIIQVANQTASGLFGNNTDLSTKVFVQNGQPITFAGKWFRPGVASVFWGNTKLGIVTIDQTGVFNATVTAPVTTAGKHILRVDDGALNVSVTVSRLPTVTYDYSGSWRTTDFPINLTSDFNVGTQIYYKVNNAQVCTVSANGQPVITLEGNNSTLEYWLGWDVYGTGNMELNHTTLTGIKLDKTPPTALMQINGGSTSTTSNTVTLSVTAADSTSGIKQIRFSNDATMNQATWEPYTNSKSWQLISGDEQKTVYCEVQDNANLTTTVSSSITLSTPQTSPTPSPTTSPTPAIPEFGFQMLIALLALLALPVLFAIKYKKGALNTKIYSL